MNKFIPFFVLLISCNAPKIVYDTQFKKEVKIYENKNYSFKYPLTWKLLINDIVVPAPQTSLSPVKEILEKEKKVNDIIVKKQYAYEYITIYKDKFKKENMELFIADKMKSVEKYKMNFTKLVLNPDHYIFYVNTNPLNKDNVLKQFFQIHYVKIDDYIIEIDVVLTPDKFDLYKEDVVLFLKTFIFKNGKRLIEDDQIKLIYNTVN